MNIESITFAQKCIKECIDCKMDYCESQYSDTKYDDEQYGERW